MNRPIAPIEIINSGLCIGCGSCAAQSTATATMNFDAYGQYKPAGSGAWLNEKNDRFTLTCPFSPRAKNEDELATALFPKDSMHHAALGTYQSSYVGHVAESDFRECGSSGGMVTWVATELLRKGLIDGVAHVIAAENPQQEGKYFEYRLARSVADVRAGAKSRYYPVEMSGMLKLITEVPGRYAIVGIPCFIKAIQLLRSHDAILKERIVYTLGLFCGHMKSARFVESLAWQMNVPLKEVAQVEFRYKDASRPANWYNAMLSRRNGQTANKDWWHLADGDWGAGFFMNNSCNFCDDVVAETADISFGDAWVEPYASDGRGTNVIVVRSREVANLIAIAIGEGRLQLKPVDSNFVEQTQAAGLRQRREGLAYRLTWKRKGDIQPVKRVLPDAVTLGSKRRLIYRLRYLISAWSHRVFSFARRVKQPWLYTWWGRVAGAIYYGIAYHNGKISTIGKRLLDYIKS